MRHSALAYAAIAAISLTSLASAQSVTGFSDSNSTQTPESVWFTTTAASTGTKVILVPYVSVVDYESRWPTFARNVEPAIAPYSQNLATWTAGISGGTPQVATGTTDIAVPPEIVNAVLAEIQGTSALTFAGFGRDPGAWPTDNWPTTGGSAYKWDSVKLSSNTQHAGKFDTEKLVRQCIVRQAKVLMDKDYELDSQEVNILIGMMERDIATFYLEIAVIEVPPPPSLAPVPTFKIAKGDPVQIALSGNVNSDFFWRWILGGINPFVIPAYEGGLITLQLGYVPIVGSADEYVAVLPTINGLISVPAEEEPGYMDAVRFTIPPLMNVTSDHAGIFNVTTGQPEHVKWSGDGAGLTFILWMTGGTNVE